MFSSAPRPEAEDESGLSSYLLSGNTGALPALFSRLWSNFSHLLHVVQKIFSSPTLFPEKLRQRI